MLKTTTFKSLSAFLTLWLALAFSATAETPARVPLPANNPAKNSEEKKTRGFQASKHSVFAKATTQHRERRGNRLLPARLSSRGC